jgi:hypothetical protein
MKKIQTLFSVAFCGAFLALNLSTPVQADQQGLVTVVRIQGEARYSLGDGNWHPLVAGKTLRPGSVIQTGHNATVDIVLGDANVPMPQAASVPKSITFAPDSKVRGYISYKPSVEQNVVRLSPDTILAVNKLMVSDTGVDTVSDTELDLRQGRVFSSVKKLSSASQFLIKIPNGVAGVRGTKFTISADGSVAVFEGSVVVSIVGSNGNPTTVVVAAGNAYNPESGQTSPMSGDMMNTLEQFAIASGTLYKREISYAAQDLTTVYVSPTKGKYTLATTTTPPPSPEE